MANELIPRLVTPLAEAAPSPVLCVGVACGSDLTGSHTAVVSRQGVAFTWGIGTALGLGTATASATPASIDAEGAMEGARVDSVACARPVIHCRTPTANQKPLFPPCARPAIHCRTLAIDVERLAFGDFFKRKYLFLWVSPSNPYVGTLLLIYRWKGVVRGSTRKIANV